MVLNAIVSTGAHVGESKSECIEVARPRLLPEYPCCDGRPKIRFVQEAINQTQGFKAAQ